MAYHQQQPAGRAVASAPRLKRHVEANPAWELKAPGSTLGTHVLGQMWGESSWNSWNGTMINETVDMLIDYYRE